VRFSVSSLSWWTVAWKISMLSRRVQSNIDNCNCGSISNTVLAIETGFHKIGKTGWCGIIGATLCMRARPYLTEGALAL